MLCTRLGERRRHYTPERRQLIICNRQTATWTKYHVIVGRPGTGKSQVLIRLMEWSTTHDLNVLLTTPTANLGSRYKAVFQNSVACDTIHTAFCVPIRPED